MSDIPVQAEEPQLRASDILTQINTKQGVKDYVGADAAVIWFYQDFPPPHGGIHTELLHVEQLIFKASVYVDGQLIATAHANPEGNSNTLKKVESAAVRRALANAGYSTKKAIIRLARHMVSEGAAGKLGSGKKEQPRRVGSQPEQKPSPKNGFGIQMPPPPIETDEPAANPRPTWASPENLEALKDILMKQDIQWSDIPSLTAIIPEQITNPNDWQQWERFAISGKSAVQLVLACRDDILAASKPATPKNAPAEEPADFLEKITYTPKIVSTGSATVPEASFLHKTNIGKVKTAVQQFYTEDGKVNTFHMNGSICKMLNAGALKIEMDVGQAVAVIEQMKQAETAIPDDSVPF